MDTILRKFGIRSNKLDNFHREFTIFQKEVEKNYAETYAFTEYYFGVQKNFLKYKQFLNKVDCNSQVRQYLLDYVKKIESQFERVARINYENRSREQHNNMAQMHNKRVASGANCSTRQAQNSDCQKGCNKNHHEIQSGKYNSSSYQHTMGSSHQQIQHGNNNPTFQTTQSKEVRQQIPQHADNFRQPGNSNMMQTTSYDSKNTSSKKTVSQREEFFNKGNNDGVSYQQQDVSNRQKVEVSNKQITNTVDGLQGFLKQEKEGIVHHKEMKEGSINAPKTEENRSTVQHLKSKYDSIESTATDNSKQISIQDMKINKSEDPKLSYNKSFKSGQAPSYADIAKHTGVVTVPNLTDGQKHYQISPEIPPVSTETPLVPIRSKPVKTIASLSCFKEKRISLKPTVSLDFDTEEFNEDDKKCLKIETIDSANKDVITMQSQDKNVNEVIKERTDGSQTERNSSGFDNNKFPTKQDQDRNSEKTETVTKADEPEKMDVDVDPNDANEKKETRSEVCSNIGITGDVTSTDVDQERQKFRHKIVKSLEKALLAAKSYETEVKEFFDAKSSVKYFCLDENLSRIIDYLDKVPCRSSEELLNMKIDIIRHIKSLLEILDRRATEYENRKP